MRLHEAKWLVRGCFGSCATAWTCGLEWTLLRCCLLTYLEDMRVSRNDSGTVNNTKFVVVFYRICVSSLSNYSKRCDYLYGIVLRANDVMVCKFRQLARWHIATFTVTVPAPASNSRPALKSPWVSENWKKYLNCFGKRVEGL